MKHPNKRDLSCIPEEESKIDYNEDSQLILDLQDIHFNEEDKGKIVTKNNNDVATIDGEGCSINQLLEMAGGFGFFQILSSIILVFALTTGGQIVYGLPFLTKYPEYDCLVGSAWKSCSRIHICDSNIPTGQWRFNYTDESSYVNFVERLGLTCTDKKLIGGLGGAYFAGFAVSAGVVSRISDIFGRKIPFFLCILVQTIAYSQIFNCSTINRAIVCYGFVGLCAGGRISIGTTYLCEIVPSSYSPLVMTLWNVADTCVMIV